MSSLALLLLIKKHNDPLVECTLHQSKKGCLSTNVKRVNGILIEDVLPFLLNYLFHFLTHIIFTVFTKHT